MRPAPVTVTNTPVGRPRGAGPAVTDTADTAPPVTTTTTTDPAATDPAQGGGADGAGDGSTA